MNLKCTLTPATLLGPPGHCGCIYIYVHIHVQHKQQFRCLFEETESDWPVPHDRKATVAPIFAHYNRGMPTICEGTRATSEQMGRIGARSRWVPPLFTENSKL